MFPELRIEDGSRPMPKKGWTKMQAAYPGPEQGKGVARTGGHRDRNFKVRAAQCTRAVVAASVS